MRLSSPFALVLSIAFAVACSSEIQPPSAVRGGDVASTITCTQATNLWPSSGVRYGDSTVLSWTYPECSLPHRLEVYDDATGVLAFADDTPMPVYQMGPTTDEYHYLYFTGNVQKGKYYRWRIRAYYDAPGSDPDVIGPWSAYATFGISPDRPIVSASIVGGKPRLTWSPPVGAATYRIYRQLNSQGSPMLWSTTSSTTYTDNATNVTGAPMGGPPGSGTWVRYHVTSVSAAGIESSYYTAWWFSTTGKIVW
jgi:hypothetical protein